MSTPDNYRSLFEGSQASLADMAARQAQALARVGRLRSAIVTVLRKNFMAQSAQAEVNLGSRLNEVDDEILLAYLDAFTAAASRGDQRATLQALREAIVAAGIPLRGDEPLLWVEQIHQHRQRLQRSGVAPVADAPSSDAIEPRRPPLVHREAPPSTTIAPESTPASAHRDAPAPMPVEDYWRWDEPSGDVSHGEDLPEANASELSTLFADVIEPSRWDNELGAVEGDHDRWSPSPLHARSAPQDAPAPPPAVATESWETGDRPASAGRDTALPSADPKQPTEAQDDVAAGQEAPPDNDEDTGPIPLVDDAPIAKSTRRAPTKAAARGETGTASRRRVRKTATPPSDDEAAVPEAHGTGTDTTPLTPIAPIASIPASDGDMHDASAGDPLPASVVAPVEAPVSGATAAPQGLTQPMRPELFPGASSSKGKTRQTRTSKAVSDDNPTLLSVTVAPTELTDGMRHALLAAASIPRPVFARDLVSIAGSLAMVDAWEAECRANVNSSPVRFVAPKSRHRLRGCLIAVDRAEARAVDWWHQAVKRYRAGRLYELGVLLHRVGDEIVSFNLEDQVAVFRLNTPRGLVGLVVVLDTRTTGEGTTLTVVAEHLDRLLTERLTMIAVLTTSAEPGSLESLITDIEDLARERMWQPAVPVIAARSWEYADDRGSSAVMVLGQG